MTIDPAAVFKPDRAMLEARTQFDESDHENIEWLQNGRAFYRGIPYSKYLDEWQFHPGRIAHHLSTVKLSPKLLRTAKRVLDHLVELPNGGVALYYPASINTSRLQSNEPVYSGIAQGQLLSACMRLMREDTGGRRKTDWRQIAERVALSLRFPFERGGICVDDRLILEAPNFRSCPEAILNGWLDALLHLQAYLVVCPSPDLQRFYSDNISAVVDLLPSFDDSGSHLSRYSNLCPYVFKVQLRQRPVEAPRVRVEYLSTNPSFKDYVISDLWPSDGLVDCPYDNKLVGWNSASIDLALSVSGLFDLRVEIEAPCESISVDPGGVDPGASLPRATLRRRKIAPAISYDGRSTIFFLKARDHGLIPGYPTNFVKHGGQNFYHVYHVVALYELARLSGGSAAGKVLEQFASRWLSYQSDPSHQRRGLRFIHADHYIRRIASLRGQNDIRTFEELQRAARS